MAGKNHKSEREKSVRKDSSKLKTPESFNRGPWRATRAWLKNLVASLYLTGEHTADSITEYLKERHQIDLKAVTIRKYLVEMKRSWQETALQDTNTMITQELARLAQLEQFAIGALRDGGLRVTDDGTYVQLGNAENYCDIMLKISKRRSALMGLDKGQKVILKDERASELTDEELEHIIGMRKGKAA